MKNEDGMKELFIIVLVMITFAVALFILGAFVMSLIVSMIGILASF